MWGTGGRHAHAHPSAASCVRGVAGLEPAAPRVNPVCHRAANPGYRNDGVIGFRVGGLRKLHANNTDDFLPA